MEPVTLVGILEGSISLAVQCCSVAKSLNKLAGQYKYARLTLSTMIQNLDIMQVAWERIGAWSKVSMPTDDAGFTQRLDKFLETGSLVLDALEEDLRSYNVTQMTFRQRPRLVWNENTSQGHQNRIRDQAQSMSLFLQAIQLPTLESTANVLQQSNKQFTKSDESAFSIVPSKMSSRHSLSTSQTSRRASSDSFAKLIYRLLCFENDLFTARVYKRNYRNARSQHQQRKESNHDCETVIPERRKRQQNEAILKLKLQSCSQGKTTTTITAKEQYADGNAELIVPGGIMVSTIHNVSLSGELEGDLEHRVGSSRSGQDGLYVRLADSLEHRINPSASAAYVNLVMACSSGDTEMVKEKLATMPNVLGSYISGSFYFCPIHAAVFNGHLEVMQTLLHHAELEGDLDQVVEKTIGGTEIDRWRPLHVATLKGNLAMVKLLLQKGATVLSETGHGIQATHLAAKIGSTSILEALFDAGAHVNCSDLRGRRPIHYISDSQDFPQVVEYLLGKGADTRSPDGSEEATPLHMACRHDFAGNLKALLFHESSRGEHFPPELESALDTAIRCGSSVSVQALLEHGVNPNYCLNDGRSGLHTFVSDYCTTTQGEDPAKLMIVRLLLEHVELLAFNDDGEMVLDSLLRLGSKNEIARLFLENLPEYKARERATLSMVIYWSS